MAARHDSAGIAADGGDARIAWASAQMPVLEQIRDRFARTRPLEGVRVGACLHITAETANLLRTLSFGGAQVALCAANPLSTQDDVAVALRERHGVVVAGERGETPDELGAHVQSVIATAPQVVIDDGADLLVGVHERGPSGTSQLIGATEETTAGLLRVRAMEAQGVLACPVLAVNESRAERSFNDYYGTGQSTVDGILRATNLLLAGRTVVVFGYGYTGRGVALRARGSGASVIVCEVDPLRALEARMAGYEVMPSLVAAASGDVFVTVTGGRDVLVAEHFEQMKDGAVLANAGHFDVEISLADLAAVAVRHEQVLPLVAQYTLANGRRLNLLADGRVVNLAAGDGHPAAVMDISFAIQALCVEHLVKATSGAAPTDDRGTDGPHTDGPRTYDPSTDGPRVVAVPDAIDAEVARLKLESLGVAIDELTDAQRVYRSAWEQPLR
jgi:adenosylhomocysteinase